MQIFTGFPGQAASNDKGKGCRHTTTAIFSAFAGYILGTFRDKANIIT